MEASAAMPRQRYKLQLEYIGSAFSGSQVAPGQRTVQGELEAALARLVPGETPSAVFAGRTDAGVHAIGNVAHVDLPPRRNGNSWQPEELLRALSSLRDIGVVATRCVPSSFHARHSAVMRTYVYRIRCCAEPTPARAYGQVSHLVHPSTSRRILLGAAGVVLTASLLLASRHGGYSPARCSRGALLSTAAAAAAAAAIVTVAAVSSCMGATATTESLKHEFAAPGCQVSDKQKAKPKQAILLCR